MVFFSTPRRDRPETVRAAAFTLAGASLLAPPVAVFAPLGVAPLVTFTALILAAADRRAALRASREPGPLALLLALLSLWAAVTASWSPIPAHSLFEAGRLLLISIGGLIILGACRSLAPGDATRIGAAALAGVVLAILLLQLELRAGQPINHFLGRAPSAEPVPMARYDRGVTVLMLMAWPATLALLRSGRWLLALVFAAATLATLLEYVSQSAALAALLGLAALPWGWVAPRLAAVGLALLVLVMGLFYPPWAPNGHEIAALHERLPAIKASGIHRLAIWSFTAERIEERPWLGWGMDAARAVPGGKRPVTTVMPEVKLPLTAEILPLHPHDAALQWRLELGIPGLLLAIALVAWLLWAIAAEPVAWYRALSLGYAAAALTVALLSFGAWQAWWLCSLWLSAACLAALRPRLREPPA